ncbi:cytochrome d ubiquinol oxidase, subunit II [Propionibacterium sp. oral taxon 192 str. F0372]|uniref:cytochrome d ubiquinol oxidase subunit II n=1 Tax=Propionibacterium sp. oral taxon 192 TaxID=671222 RepID=UPI0003539366|nr:cytochrome d ubiquinol oxidase subunit II [Propionibacterium sp. oral taxon 192]EPH03734.1 cytochrome d ubiquinol oxidase, subunit II [Propionibacterium sp. oral taxon 192 str. F0372]
MSHETLITIWFLLEAVLWIGFFFLEGFDFGVAMLYPVIGRDPRERRVMINAIGPTWDANEVWLIAAGGAMFAAFPGWYSALFAGLYLPLLLVLLGLIVRAISFEYRALMPDDNWRDSFDWCSTIGSLIVSLVFGVGFANMWIGMPMAGDPAYVTSSFWSLFSPFGLLGGILAVALFMVHGAVFLSLKTSGEVREKANRVVKALGPVALLLLVAFIVIGNIAYPASDNPFLGDGATMAMWITGVVCVVALGFAVVMHNRQDPWRREGLAFLGTGAAIIALFASHFIKMYGTLGFAPAPGTEFNAGVAASSQATLSLMSMAALVIMPIVLACTAWSYTVFRRRLSVRNMPPEPSEAAEVLAKS